MTSNELRALRRRYGLTRSKLAKHLGVSGSTIYRWEGLGGDTLPVWLEAWFRDYASHGALAPSLAMLDAIAPPPAPPAGFFWDARKQELVPWRLASKARLQRRARDARKTNIKPE